MANLLTKAIHQNGIDETKKVFSHRLVIARKEKDMTARELGEKIAKKQKLSSFRVATISTWENAHNLPRMSYIEILSEILEVDTAFLLGLQDETHIELNNKKGLKEISYDKLKNYNNQPVWCVYKDDDMSEGFWGIVNAKSNMIVTSYQAIHFKKINFSVYSFLSPYSFAIDSNMEILTKNEVRDSKKVWVQGVGGSYMARQRLKGYYEYNDKVDCVINNSGMLLSLDTYGINWVAYNEEVIEKEPQKLL